MAERYAYKIELDTYCCDGNQIVKPSGALQVLQEAGRRQMEAQKPSYEEILEAGKALMLSRIDMKIYDEAYVGEKVEVSSWPCDSSRATFLRMYQMKRGKEIIAEISSQWVLVESATRKILKVDDVDFSNYYRGPYKDLIPEKFRIPKTLQLEEAGRFHVTYSYLDSNKHMNNTYYANMLCDHVPELTTGEYRVSSMRIHYSKEAPMGEVLTILRASSEKGKYLFKTIKSNGELNIEAEVTVVPVK